MSQLTLGAEPNFTDVPEDTLVAAQPLRHVAIQSILEDGKFAAVRLEYVYEGFFQHGDTVPVSVSPVDGYTYARSEIQYRVMPFSSRGVGGGFSAGMKTRPNIAASQPANLYWWEWDVDDATGLVSLQTSYFEEGGDETLTNDGIVKVIAVCQRQSDNTFVGSGGAIGPTGTGVVTLAPGAPAYLPPTTYTIQESDNGKYLTFNTSSPVTITVPDISTFSPDFWFSVLNEGSGLVTLNTVTDLFRPDDSVSTYSTWTIGTGIGNTFYTYAGSGYFVSL